VLTPADCALPDGWSIYVVDPRTTLFTIALAVDSTVEELRVANCLEDADRIRAGDSLFVPKSPVEPVATFFPSEVDIGGEDGGTDLAPIGCDHPSVTITDPTAEQIVSESYPITGSALIEDFAYYILEIRPHGVSDYSFYARSDMPAFRSGLGHLDPTAFATGVYWLRLIVFDSSDNSPAGASCAIPIRFE
jgi:hypothetical protein